MSLDLLFKLKQESASRKNFAVKLVREWFSEEERRTSNVAGKKGKKKLNEVKMGIVKTKTFFIWPLEHNEVEKTVWAGCVAAIDEANRRLNNKPNKKRLF